MSDGTRGRSETGGWPATSQRACVKGSRTGEGCLAGAVQPGLRHPVHPTPRPLFLMPSPFRPPFLMTVSPGQRPAPPPATPPAPRPLPHARLSPPCSAPPRLSAPLSPPASPPCPRPSAPTRPPRACWRRTSPAPAPASATAWPHRRSQPAGREGGRSGAGGRVRRAGGGGEVAAELPAASRASLQVWMPPERAKQGGAKTFCGLGKAKRDVVQLYTGVRSVKACGHAVRCSPPGLELRARPHLQRRCVGVEVLHPVQCKLVARHVHLVEKLCWGERGRGERGQAYTRVTHVHGRRIYTRHAYTGDVDAVRSQGAEVRRTEGGRHLCNVPLYDRARGQRRAFYPHKSCVYVCGRK